MSAVWTVVLYALLALGGGLYAWWDTTLSRIRLACALANAQRRADELFAYMQTPECKASSRRAFEMLSKHGGAAFNMRRGGQ